MVLGAVICTSSFFFVNFKSPVYENIPYNIPRCCEISKPFQISRSIDINTLRESQIIPSNNEHAYILGGKHRESYCITKRMITEQNGTTISPPTQKPKRILVYTKYFGEFPWKHLVNYKFEFGPFCPVTNCEFVFDKGFIQSSDLLIFHGRDLESPSEYKRIRYQVPSEQIWMFLNQESPANNAEDTLEPYNGLFNVTATLKTESEINTNFGKVYSLCEDDDKKDRPKLGTDFSKKKKRVVLAIISHCFSYRLKLLQYLQNYVDLDVYGDCSRLVKPYKFKTCSKFSKECDNLWATYRFYFAVENTFCKDYLSEKVYMNSFHRGLVPIIMADGNIPFQKLLPPHSWINIMDFKNLQDLGKYLTYLSKNDTAYNEYHAWRYNYRHILTFSVNWCDICQMLWERDGENIISTVNIGEFFSKKQCNNWSEDRFQRYLK